MSNAMFLKPLLSDECRKLYNSLAFVPLTYYVVKMIIVIDVMRDKLSSMSLCRLVDETVSSTAVFDLVHVFVSLHEQDLLFCCIEMSLFCYMSSAFILLDEKGLCFVT